ncbi:MAG: DUF1957 domain-containing protein [Planctomycetes bacterium]|nr:DUF1957 domain-containing protein [Planctomycetota bacterium]
MPTSCYLSLVLHTHLPWVKHPEYPDFLEEDWLFEAITESYVPQLILFRKLRAQGIPFRVTLSMTPPLCEMLADHVLRSRYVRHINALCSLSASELERTKGTEYEDVAHHYYQRFHSTRDFFISENDGNILGAYRDLQNSGHVEIITCAATHGFLPFVRMRGATLAQLGVGVENYKKHFGRAPRGIWLPECAFYPGLQEDLGRLGIRFFLLDSHGILFGSRPPRYGIYAPMHCGNGTFGIGRDTESSSSVWSATHGYPGHPSYREFYKDLGYEADYEYIKIYLHSDGVRRNIGIKYHKVTGKVQLHDKQVYRRSEALAQTVSHAHSFLQDRIDQARNLSGKLRIAPMVLSPYDAELFGHWWYEGPEFLYSVLELAGTTYRDIRLVSPIDYINEGLPCSEGVPSASTWGDQGYHGVWLNETNDWIYRHQHEIERRMAHHAIRFQNPTGEENRLLNQMGRELLLAQSSDWAFIMTNDTVVPYAHKRFKTHVANFLRIERFLLRSEPIDHEWMRKVEASGSIFQELSYTVFRAR